MYKNSVHIKPFILRNEFITVGRITALWAFSESAFGGILHALKAPFTGLFVGGAAIIFLTLIAHFASNKSELIQSTLIVILIKGIISPHSPLTAYFAVMLQGVLAFIYFSLIPSKKISALLLGISALGLSAFQKVIVLTLVFGNTLWHSIDAFGIYILDIFGLKETAGGLQFSRLLIGLYGGIHIFGGIIFGIIAGRIPNWIKKNSFRAERYNNLILHKDEKINAYRKKKGKKKKSWWRRRSGIIFILFSAGMIIIVYFNPQLENSLAVNIFVMLIRSIAVTYIWFALLAPVIIKYLKKFLIKKESQYSTEIDFILNMFPYFKGIINYSWETTNDYKNYKRFIPFLKNSFVLLLLADIESYEKDIHTQR